MIHLINFEIKKLLNKKRNLVMILLFLVISISFIFLYSNSEKTMKKSKEIFMDNNIESLELELVRIKEEMLRLPDNKNLKDIYIDYNKEIDTTKNMKNFYKNNEWSKYLESRISLNESLLQNIKSNKVITSNSIDSIEKEIEIDKILLDKGIEPINTEVSMEGFNFIKVFLNGPLVLMIMILVIFITSDVMSSEFESNTYKLLFTQPISKIKILLSKIIASVFMINSVVFLVIGGLFLTLGMTKGFGSVNYPTAFYSNGNIEYIEAGKYIILELILFFLLITLICILSIFISSFNKSTNTSISLTIIISLSLYFISNKGLINNIAHINPFTYLQIGEVLQGSLANVLSNSNINIQNGLLISIVLMSILLTANIYLFDKRDIVS